MELPGSRYHLLSYNTGSVVGVNSASSINDQMKVLRMRDMFVLEQPIPFGRL